MTAMAMAMRTAKDAHNAKLKQELKAFIKIGYSSFNVKNNNPLNAPNYYQRMFMLGVNRELSKIFVNRMGA